MIDFANLPMLIGPRFKRLLSERSDREKLAHSHMRRAKGPKNHATNRERSRDDRRKAAVAKRADLEFEAIRSDYLEKVRAFWRGDLDVHPVWKRK